MKRRASQGYEFGPFRLDQGEQVLLCQGKPISITAKAFEILLLLVERSNHIVEKEEIFQTIWPDVCVEEGNLNVHIFALRKALGDGEGNQSYIETVPRRGYRFVAAVREWRDAGNELLAPPEMWEPVGGVVPLDSWFYIARPADAEFRAAIARRDSIVLVKGARQVGKTSLLARGLQQARETGAKVVLTDFQMLNASALDSVESFFLALAELIAKRLDLDLSPRAAWDPLCGPNLNFERFWQRQALSSTSASVVWGLDEVDRLFTCPFASEVFALFRSWHNARALDPEGPWRRLTLAMAYATEAHLFITDLNQSPFNVGTRILLEDFAHEQVAELNCRYASPLGEAEVEGYFRLIGGHPYLARRGLYEMAAHAIGFSELAASAASDEGAFGDHLRRMLAALARNPALCEVVREMLRGGPCPTAESFYRLRSAGVIAGDAPQSAQPRCELYAAYLRRHLL
ncbi:MAG: AAA-like domain-containing protein [Acidobacteriota bacterium]